MLWWNSAAQHYDRLYQQLNGDQPPQTLRFTASLQLNEFRGVQRVQGVIDDQLEDTGA